METNFEKTPKILGVLDERQTGEANYLRLDGECREAARELEHLSVWQRAQQKALKSRFNVFTAVLKYNDEVRLHSRWLLYLLNPEAEHDCGALFLKLFVDTLREKGAKRHKDGQYEETDRMDDELQHFPTNDELDRMGEVGAFESYGVKVGKGPRTEHGEPDIQIKSPGVLVVIENKTRPGEGEGQVGRYANYCREHCEGRDQQFLLLFLTPDGSSAQSAGEHEDTYPASPTPTTSCRGSKNVFEPLTHSSTSTKHCNNTRTWSANSSIKGAITHI
jgi:hypothetical protein